MLTEEELNDLVERGKIAVMDLFDEIDEDDIPEGCEACGGPYPDCRDSCPIFDD